MHKLKLFLSIMLLLSFVGCAGTNQQQSKSDTATDTGESAYALDQELPVGPHVEKGQFANGLTYYIRKNSRPENRMELRLVVNAGSILEDENQQGLAHFTEHMAFNGTEHFEKQELVNYLESIGMRFGPDINAYTSFDETVYMLQLPTDSASVMKEGFQVLEDWAHALTFTHEEIDKERGVVQEEWRLGRGVQARIREEQYPILFHNSRYAERLPIGKKAVLDTFHYEALTSYYNTWYRPELMGVVAIGDFDPGRIHTLIGEHFQSLEPKPEAPERKIYQVPDHEETLFAIASDPEATQSGVSIYYKQPATHEETVADYRQGIVERLYNQMFNQRLSELTQTEDPPFLSGYSGQGQFVRSKEFYYLGATVEDNGLLRGFETLLTEAERVRKHGFTATELEREKQSILRSIEQTYRERNKTRSRRYASEYIRNFLFNEPIPGIEYEYAVYREYVPTISLEEVNQLAEEWITDKNRVVMTESPEKEGNRIPGEEDLRGIMQKVADKDIVAYKDDVKDQPLMEKVPEPAEIVADTIYEDVGVTEWTLANGIRVALKPTDFKNDEVRFASFSWGGTSLVPDSNLIPAETAISIIGQSGVGDFSEIQLGKLLSDKVVSVSPYIGQLSEGMSGSASPEDLETMFQLISLYFTEIRRDSTAFASFKSRYKAYYANQGANPERAYQDTLTTTLTQHHPRFKPYTVETFEQMDLDKSMHIYRERFADAGEFTFVFVGNFNPDSLKPLVKTYLGSLKDLPGEEQWRDVTYSYPDSVIKKTVRKGIEPKARTAIAFTGMEDWTPKKRYVASALTDYLSIKLREVVREDLGGTYGVSVNGRFPRLPRERYRIRISFGADPERIQELTDVVFAQIDSLKEHGVGKEYLQKITEIDLRNHETNLKENSYWMNQIKNAYYYGTDMGNILTYPDLVNSITTADIQKAAQRYLNMDDYVQITLLPEQQ
ncbi:MAG: insulinase family protein [Candidatus Marinimicrobia bacterium]|nr:insulinase family protein [Candidatus Neomarinimicrobiota bacterium]MCF7828164.1 insulinase family protein [Candidatus Neomarinimicrobiota bacterium]MCF7879661.1 insulinase family protein [Candidatus Neomarinimicrobiota bacterium]